MASFKFVYLFILVSFISLVNTEAQDDLNYLGYSCPDSDVAPRNSSFESNVKTLLSYLSTNATSNKQFYNTTVVGRNHSDTVYGMFTCWGNVPPQLCSHCVKNITEETIRSDSSLGNCSLSKDAFIYYDECMVRFSNRSIFSILDLTSPLGRSCGSPYSESNGTDAVNLLFSEKVKEAADEAATSGIGTKKYATKQARVSGFLTLFLEVRCTPDLSAHDCRKCLNATLTDHAQLNCQGSLSGSFSYSSCQTRYEVYPFYRPSTTTALSGVLIPVTNSSPTDTDSQEFFHNCSSNKAITTTDRASIRTLLSSSSINTATKTSFLRTTVNNTVNGLFMCRGNITATLCKKCLLNATHRISTECFTSAEAVIWYNHCLIRYSYVPSPTTHGDTSPAYRDFNIANNSNPNQLQSFFTWTSVNTLFKLVQDIDGNALKNYGTKSVKLNDKQTLYTLAQCSGDLSNSDCRSCLYNILQMEIPWCCLASPEGKVLLPNCYMMFGLSQFYGDSDQVDEDPSPTPRKDKKGGSQAIIVIIVLVVVLAVFLSLICCYLRRRKAKESRYKTLLTKNFGHDSITLQGLQFDFTVIKTATNNFSQDNRIGKGGFGEVFKVCSSVFDE